MPLAAAAAEAFASILSNNSVAIPANRTALPPALALEVKYTYSRSDGRFIFKDLKDGKYRLAAVRDGMYPVEFGQRDSSQRGILFPVTAGQANTELKLEMTPTGAISGRVVDEDGQPIGHAVVYALAQEYRAGRKQFYIETATLTDERGDYRLFWLRPGKYAVAATFEDPQRRTTNLMITAPGRTMFRERATSPVVLREMLHDGTVVEEVYGVVYHGGVLDPDKATWVEVQPAATFVGADISFGVGKGRTHHIRGLVLNNETGQPISGAQIVAIPRQSNALSVVLVGTSNANGVFDLAGARPEGYMISVRGSGPPVSIAGRNIPGPPLFGEAAVAMGASDVEASVVLNPGISLPGRVVIEGGAAGDLNFTNLKIVLTREPDLIAMPDPLLPPYPPLAPGTRSGGAGNGQVSAVGEFTLLTSPGDFRVNVEGIPTNTYVKSIRMGREDIQASTLRVTKAQNDLIQITLGSDGGIISGSVVDAIMRPFSNATIVLIPAERGRLELYRNTTSDFFGAFRFSAIRPGNYTLLAWDWALAGSWLNVEFVRVYETQGKSVQVESGKAENIQLEAISRKEEAR
jgi:hypothetical protein